MPLWLQCPLKLMWIPLKVYKKNTCFKLHLLKNTIWLWTWLQRLDHTAYCTHAKLKSVNEKTVFYFMLNWLKDMFHHYIFHFSSLLSHSFFFCRGFLLVSLIVKLTLSPTREICSNLEAYAGKKIGNILFTLCSKMNDFYHLQISLFYFIYEFILNCFSL